MQYNDSLNSVQRTYYFINLTLGKLKLTIILDARIRMLQDYYTLSRLGHCIQVSDMQKFFRQAYRNAGSTKITSFK